MPGGNVSGQYTGGAGDGHEMGGIVQSRLNGSQPNTIPMYVGGPGDGHTFGQAASSLAGGDVTMMYSGASGDGHDQSSFAGALDGQSTLALYRGGDGDGFDKGSFAGVLDGFGMVALFNGGTGDGYSDDSFAGALDGTALAALFAGGAGDGFSSHDFAGLLDGPSVAMLYGGGNGDGFVTSAHHAALSGQNMAALYRGGPGDGYDQKQSQIIIQAADCSIVINTDDDGFGSLRYAVNCAQPGDTISFSHLLNGDTITLTTGAIDLYKNVSILAEADDDMHLDASGVVRNFDILPGTQVVISGLQIIVGNGAVGAGIKNEGHLTIIDLTMINPYGTSSLATTSGSQLTVQGVCYLIE